MAFRSNRLPPPSEEEIDAQRAAYYGPNSPRCPHCGWPLDTLPVRERRHHRSGGCQADETEGATHDDHPEG